MLNAYHQCNQRQLGIKTATDQRHKVGDKCHAWYYPYHLTSVVWKLKNRRQKREKDYYKGSMTLLIFLSRLQIENYVMTAFSIQPIRTYGQKTIFSHVQVAVAKI